jgi:hypothetical protein
MIRARRQRIPLQDTRRPPLLTYSNIWLVEIIYETVARYPQASSLDAFKYLATRDHVRELPPIFIYMSVNSRIFDKSMLKITYDS